MTDQPSSRAAADSTESTPAASGAASGPSLPRFQPLPPSESAEGYDPSSMDDEPSPFISDRIKSGDLGKSEMPKGIWIWSIVAIALLGLAIFGLAQRPSETTPEVQIIEPES